MNSFEYYDRGVYYQDLYIKTNDFDTKKKMLSNFSKGADTNVECIDKLIKIYNDEFNIQQNDFKRSKFSNFVKWHKIAIKKYNSINAMINLAKYYYFYNNIKLFIEYNNMANTKESIYGIADYYMKLEKTKENINNVLIYLAKADELNHDQAYYDLKYYYDYHFINSIHLYNTLIEIPNLPLVLRNKIIKLEKKIDINSFKNKKRLFSELNNYKDCIICYNNKLNIILDCGHEICIECYYKVNNKCYYKCKKNNNSI